MPPMKAGGRSMTSSARQPSHQSWPRLFAAAGRQAVIRLFRSEDFTYASSIAYYALISLFPCLLFAVSVVRRLTDSLAERAAVRDLVLQFFPDRVDLVSGQLDRLAAASLGFEIVATVLITWAALGVFQVISRAVNHAWDLKEPTGFFRHQLMGFAMLLALGCSWSWRSAGSVWRRWCAARGSPTSSRWCRCST